MIQLPEVPVEPEITCPMSDLEGQAEHHQGRLMEFYDVRTGQAFWGSSCCNWFIILDPVEEKAAKARHRARAASLRPSGQERGDAVTRPGDTHSA